MSDHKTHYPQHLTPCQFCGGNDVHMNAALVRLPDGKMTGAFDLECKRCGFSTKPYQYPAIAAHAWNMAKKLSVQDVMDDVLGAYNKTSPKPDDEH